MTNNLLKEIKELGLEHDKVLEILKASMKAEGEEEEELDEEEEEEEEEEPVEEAKDKNADLEDAVKLLTKEVKDLKNKTIKRKKPGKAKKIKEDDVPEIMTFSVQKNMFEEMV